MGGKLGDEVALTLNNQLSHVLHYKLVFLHLLIDKLLAFIGVLSNDVVSLLFKPIERLEHLLKNGVNNLMELVLSGLDLFFDLVLLEPRLFVDVFIQEGVGLVQVRLNKLVGFGKQLTAGGVVTSQRVEHLVNPGVQWVLSHLHTLVVVEVEHIEQKHQGNEALNLVKQTHISPMLSCKKKPSPRSLRKK